MSFMSRVLLAILLAMVLIPFTSEAADTSRLTLLKAFMQPRIRGREPYGYSWSRDDRLLAYLWNEKGWSYNEVWVLDPGSGEKYRVTNFESIELEQAREANAEEKDAEKKMTEEELIEETHKHGGVGSPVWGADGLLYVPWAGDIWRLPPDKPKDDEKGLVEFAKPELFLDLEGWV
jgi:hypothetical protein